MLKDHYKKSNKISVEYINHMGNDLTVVNAAKVSFSKDATKEYMDQCESWKLCNFNPDFHIPILKKEHIRLIRYLALHNHWTPFGHVQLQVRVSTPLFVARQLGKHQTGLVWNEESRRYISDEPEFFFPDEWRKKPENKKQGSSDEIFEGDEAKFNNSVLDILTETALHNYQLLLESGVAPEQARMILPQNMMVNWYWTGSLAAFARIYGLRSKPDTQKETQEFAIALSDIIKEIFPVSWHYLTNQYRINHLMSLIDHYQERGLDLDHPQEYKKIVEEKDNLYDFAYS